LVEVCERFYNEQSVYYTKEKYEGFIKWWYVRVAIKK
jgi:hypothetical protein